MRPTKTYDQERVHFNLAKLKKSGVEYQIVVDPDKAVSFKEGQDIPIMDIVKSDGIFFDAKKGEHASEERMREVFGTDDHFTIAATILREGEVQLTAEHRAKVRDDKKKQIVALIAKNACDPRTKLPHPAARIENAMEEARVKIDEFATAQNQVADIIRQLRPILPISVETRQISVQVPSQFAAKSYGAIQGFGTVKQESWLNDGSWKGVIEVPAGLVNEFFDKLNAMTHGSVQTEIVK